jgi:hypothetical protein
MILFSNFCSHVMNRDRFVTINATTGQIVQESDILVYFDETGDGEKLKPGVGLW